MGDERPGPPEESLQQPQLPLRRDQEFSAREEFGKVLIMIGTGCTLLSMTGQVELAIPGLILIGVGYGFAKPIFDRLAAES